MKPVNDSRDTGCHPFSADRPIEARSEDLLGRAQFAEALAEAIGAWRERDSLVIALYGGWGSGKTSIKNMALEALRESSSRVHAVEFNPWEWSGQERLFEAFFAEIGTAVGKIPGAGSQRLRRWAEKWQAYGAYLQAGAVLTGGLRRLVTIALLLLAAGWLLPGILGTTSFSPLLTSVGVFIALLAAFLQFGGDLSSRMADAFLLSSVQSALTLADMKLELRRVLQTSQQTIVVVIDDIDRLPADHILSLFQLVKANADFPGLVYVLLFEKTLVDVLSTGGQITPDFIEKIVQVGFDVPVIERSRLEGVLFTELNRMLAVPAAENKFQQDRWQALFVEGLRPYLNTLRQVKRFTSSLSFNVALLSRTGTLEVNVVDLIGLEALRVFEIDLYRRLPRSKPVLTGEDPFYEFLGDDADQRKRAVIQQLLCLASEDRRGAAKAILGELFPDVKRLASDFGFAAGDQDAWARQARICSPRFFDKYFQLSIAQDDISLQELEDVLSAIGNKDALVSKLAGLRDRSLLETTIDRLDPYKESIGIEHAVSFLTALFTVSEWFEDRDRGFFELDPVARVVTDH